MINCPICNSEASLYATVQERSFFCCPNCTHIFLDPIHYLSQKEETERYSLHNNNADDSGYVTYLSKIIAEVREAVPEECLSMGVIDYGSCAEAVLSMILNKQGTNTVPHDPIFGHAVPQDFLPVGCIVASEVVEHFHYPLSEFTRMHKWLVEGGYLFIKTSLTDTVKNFETWWYQKDPTHVQFFSKSSFEGLGKMLGFEVIFADGNSVLLRKL